MRGASRLLWRCRPLLAQVGERQPALVCKPAAPWAASSRARWATTVADTGAPLASPDSAGGPLGAYTRGVETGKYRADPQQVRRGLGVLRVLELTCSHAAGGDSQAAALVGRP